MVIFNPPNHERRGKMFKDKTGMQWLLKSAFKIPHPVVDKLQFVEKRVLADNGLSVIPTEGNRLMVVPTLSLKRGDF